MLASTSDLSKENVKYFGGILEEFNVFEISCWGVMVTVVFETI